MSNAEIGRQSFFITNSPGELASYLSEVRRRDPAITVDEVYRRGDISANHEVSGEWYALERAGFSVQQIREHFIGTKTPPSDGSM